MHSRTIGYRQRMRSDKTIDNIYNNGNAKPILKVYFTHPSDSWNHISSILAVPRRRPSRGARNAAWQQLKEQRKMNAVNFFHILSSAVLSALVLASTTVCHAQGYPSKTIRMVVPIAVGGATDTAARLI